LPALVAAAGVDDEFACADEVPGSEVLGLADWRDDEESAAGGSTPRGSTASVAEAHGAKALAAVVACRGLDPGALAARGVVTDDPLRLPVLLLGTPHAEIGFRSVARRARRARTAARPLATGIGDADAAPSACSAPEDDGGSPAAAPPKLLLLPP
jgi:hypothetical protein